MRYSAHPFIPCSTRKQLRAMDRAPAIGEIVRRLCDGASELRSKVRRWTPVQQGGRPIGFPVGGSYIGAGRVDRVRTFAGYREYPKYSMVSRYFVYKQALMEVAERFVQAGVLREKEDIFYLRFQEIADVLRTNRVDEEVIRQRKEAFN